VEKEFREQRLLLEKMKNFLLEHIFLLHFAFPLTGGVVDVAVAASQLKGRQ
jgi:hypothetical protein